MTDNPTPLDYSDSGAASSTESKPNWRRELENRLKEAEARASDAEGNELLVMNVRIHFGSAGLDLADARVKYFVKGYEGELDPLKLSVRKLWLQGLLGENAPSIPQLDARLESTDVLRAEQRIQNAGEGGDPVSQADLEARIKATKNEDELRALMESRRCLVGGNSLSR